MLYIFDCHSFLPSMSSLPHAATATAAVAVRKLLSCGYECCCCFYIRRTSPSFPGRSRATQSVGFPSGPLYSLSSASKLAGLLTARRSCLICFLLKCSLCMCLSDESCTGFLGKIVKGYAQILFCGICGVKTAVSRHMNYTYQLVA